MELLPPALHVRSQSGPDCVDQSSAIHAAILWVETDSELHGEQLSRARLIRVLCIRDLSASGDSVVGEKRKACGAGDGVR